MESKYTYQLECSLQQPEVFSIVKQLYQQSQSKGVISYQTLKNKQVSATAHNQNPEVEKNCTVNQSKIQIILTQPNFFQHHSPKNYSPYKKYSKTQNQAKQKISKKQITEVSTEERSTILRESFLNRIENAIYFLVGGLEVDKYCYRIKKIQASFLFFSQDLQYMGIRRVIDGTTKIINMKQCQGIIVGIKTQRFKDYVDSGYLIKEQTAFSILFPNRSYDFTIWCEAIRGHLIHYLNFLQPNNQK